MLLSCGALLFTYMDRYLFAFSRNVPSASTLAAEVGAFFDHRVDVYGQRDALVLTCCRHSSAY